MLPGKGTTVSKVLDSPAATPSSGNHRCRGRRLRTAKKRGSLSPPRTAHRPVTEGNVSKMTEERPTGRRRHDKSPWYEATKKKQRSYPPPLFDAFSLTDG